MTIPAAIATWKFGMPAVEKTGVLLGNGADILDAVEYGINVVELDPEPQPQTHVQGVGPDMVMGKRYTGAEHRPHGEKAPIPCSRLRRSAEEGREQKDDSGPLHTAKAIRTPQRTPE